MPYEEYGYEPLGVERSSVLARLVGLNRFVITVLIGLAGLFTLWPSSHDEAKQQEELKKLTANRDQMQEDLAYLKQKLEWIRNDPDYLEARARDILGLQKDGEKIVQFRNE